MVQPDEVYDFAINALKSGLRAEELRMEIEAAIRFAEQMKWRDTQAPFTVFNPDRGI